MGETSPTIRWSPHSRPDNQRFLKIVGRNSKDHELSLFTVSHQVRYFGVFAGEDVTHAMVAAV